MSKWKFWTDPETTPIDKQIARVLDAMDATDTDSDEYKELMKRLERLNKLTTTHRRKRVSWDTILIVSGNILMTVIVVGYEQKHVLTSRAYDKIRPTNPPA